MGLFLCCGYTTMYVQQPDKPFNIFHVGHNNKNNTAAGNLKKNQTWVASMASNTHDHCTTTTG